MNSIYKLIHKLPPFEQLVTVTNTNMKDNTIIITVSIISSCNYKCSYCYNIRNNEKLFININELYNFLNILNSNTRKNIILLIVGGEPTFHPELYTFCKLCENLDYLNIFIHSNLSNNISLYKTLITIKNTFFIFSWHSENKDFYKKALEIKNYVTDFIFKKLLFIIMYEHLNINLSKLMYTLLKRINATLELSLIDITIKGFNNYVYTDEQILDAIELTKDNSETHLILTYSNGEEFAISEFLYNCLVYFGYIQKFSNWKCYSGYYLLLLYIHTNGDIYPCMVSHMLKLTKIGHITDTMFDKNIEIQCCDHCRCPPVSKFKNN